MKPARKHEQLHEPGGIRQHRKMVPMDSGWHGLRYAREMGVERAVQGDIRGLPFSDGAFDLVMSVDVCRICRTCCRICRAARRSTCSRHSKLPGAWRNAS
jgi:hypothetical protein